MMASEWDFHGRRVQAQTVIKVDAARRSPCLDAFERQIHTARLCLDFGGPDIADDSGDE